MRSGGRAVAVGLLTLFVVGCVSGGIFPATHVTDVRLDGGDYSVVATDVTGEASAGYLLGVTAPFGGEASTVAVARVSGAEFLYASALDDLWSEFEAEHGDAEGRALALTNVRFDADALNLILFTRSTISIRADVIEYP